MNQCGLTNCNRDSSSNTIPHYTALGPGLVCDLRAIAVLLCFWIRTLDCSILGLAILHEFLAEHHSRTRLLISTPGSRNPVPFAIANSEQSLGAPCSNWTRISPPWPPDDAGSLIDSQGDSLRRLWLFDRHTRLGRSGSKLLSIVANSIRLV